MIKHTPNDNKKMFRLLWTLVIVAIVAAEDATCGDIKALYQSESCCGAGDTTLTNLETVGERDHCSLQCFPVRPANCASHVVAGC